ncbi:hypothetical protein BH09MYX1_BH09MYX1_13650 [soil metagenome]
MTKSWATSQSLIASPSAAQNHGFVGTDDLLAHDDDARVGAGKASPRVSKPAGVGLRIERGRDRAAASDATTTTAAARVRSRRIETLHFGRGDGRRGDALEHVEEGVLPDLDFGSDAHREHPRELLRVTGVAHLIPKNRLRLRDRERHPVIDDEARRFVDFRRGMKASAARGGVGADCRAGDHCRSRGAKKEETLGHCEWPRAENPSNRRTIDPRHESPLIRRALAPGLRRKCPSRRLFR